MQGHCLAFGPFVLNAEAGTLLRRKIPVPVGYRGLLLLKALAKRPGEVLTKSDLIEAAWPGTVVEEMQAGYAIGDRVLRPALVSISKRAAKKPEAPATEDAAANENAG